MKEECSIMVSGILPWVFFLSRCRKHDICCRGLSISNQWQERWFSPPWIPTYLEQRKAESKSNDNQPLRRPASHANVLTRPTGGDCRMESQFCGGWSLAPSASDDEMLQLFARACQLSSALSSLSLSLRERSLSWALSVRAFVMDFAYWVKKTETLGPLTDCWFRVVVDNSILW